MRTVLPVMALESEAQGVFAAAGVAVLFTGVGKVNAAHALTRRLAGLSGAAERASTVILNLGTAGSPRFPVGALVACTGFVQRDMDASALGFAHGTTPFDALPPLLQHPTPFTELPQAICGSGDNFETCAPDLPCEVLDMEAYALARVCALEGVEFVCVKYITDGADADAANDWQSNLAAAAAHWLDLYRRLVAG